MKTIHLTLINTSTGCTQSASICEPVDVNFIKDNALKRFGLTMADLEIVSSTSESSLEAVVGKVRDTSNIVSLLIF